MQVEYNYNSRLGLIVRESAHMRPGKYRGILLLDRDGVVIEEQHYLNDPNKVRLIEGACDTLRVAADKGWATAIVSNQAGVAKGKMTMREYVLVSIEMERLLKEQNVHLDLILACPHHADSKDPIFSNVDYGMRKPAPGMLKYACSMLHVKAKDTFMVGDKICDIEAGHHFGCRQLFHVLTGHGIKHRGDIQRFSAEHNQQIMLVSSIADIESAHFT